MSQLLAPAQTVVDRIPLWRRIRELMKEKGSRYSMTAVANRLGISRETLRLMLNGEREIFMFELEKIANDLKLPLARILQHDIQDLHEQLQEKKDNLQDMDLAMELAKQRYTIAQGLSEKAYALLDIRYLYAFQDKWTEAEEVSLTAQELILQIGLTEQEDEVLFRLQNHLVTIYQFTKRYEKALEVLKSMKQLNRDLPVRIAAFHHNMGICLHGLNKVEEAKESFHKALELLQDLDRQEWIGRVYFCYAYLEYCEMNYHRSKELINKALQHLKTEVMRIGAVRDLAKVLLKLRDHQAAEALILETLQSEAIEQNSEMEGRLLILLSKTRDLPYHAEAVAGNYKYAKNIRFLAAKFLRLYYRRWFMQGRRKRVKAVGKLPRRRFPYDKFL
ncbi:tetratricopeptide repeat protein [Tumebacillus sp. BK434]|uniref:helix-turn-helix domain-containing protein n=1 Tax=Tumebacillus sp. BK434 TaxID=2512169 RepID=UPI00104ED735|nr:helix-turn-helix transcriptional regulator [Tumebacillus sp. BK434]TCP59023.1 tetratricopeptide repeat protein [Tumebacillus sp. BK434]